MSERNDGGPAFPHVADLVRDHGDGNMTTKQITAGGMSLRDYFAAKAMQGLVTTLTNSTTTTIVAESYEFADAMLAERERQS